MDTEVYFLKRPFEYNGNKIDRLAAREPTLGDLEAVARIDEAKETSFHVTAVALSLVTGFELEVLKANIKAVDYYPLSEIVSRLWFGDEARAEPAEGEKEGKESAAAD